MAIRMDMASKMYSSFSRRSGYYAANFRTSCRESCRSAKNHVLWKMESTTILWGLQRSGNEHQVFHDLCQGSRRSTKETILVSKGGRDIDKGLQSTRPVSYTHLTLPTNREV